MAEILSYNPYRDMHNDVQFSAMFFGKNIQNIPFFSSTQTSVKEFDLYGLKVFTFTGKERDSETGFSYFGARYYDSDLMTGWLSVDPLADKYPSLSPYAYCAWNPVKLVDPDGEDIWEFNSTGNLNIIPNNNYDQVQIKDDKGNIVGRTNTFEYGTISEIKLSNQNTTAIEVCGSKNAEEIFEFLASYYTKDNGVPMEWGHATLNSTDDISIIGTNHKPKSISLLRELTDEGYSVNSYVHNHPSGNPTPSMIYDKNGNLVAGDIKSATNHINNHPGISLYTYTPITGYSKYDALGTLDMRILTRQPSTPFSSLGWDKKK